MLEELREARQLIERLSKKEVEIRYRNEDLKELRATYGGAADPITFRKKEDNVTKFSLKKPKV